MLFKHMSLLNIMPLQTSGEISLSQIQSEYGGANNISISEYYNNAPNTTPNVSTSRISKLRMKGISGTIDQNAAIREFEFDGHDQDLEQGATKTSKL